MSGSTGRRRKTRRQPLGKRKRLANSQASPDPLGAGPPVADEGQTAPTPPNPSSRRERSSSGPRSTAKSCDVTSPSRQRPPRVRRPPPTRHGARHRSLPQAASPSRASRPSGPSAAGRQRWSLWIVGASPPFRPSIHSGARPGQ
jgi:hypothetical protein